MKKISKKACNNGNNEACTDYKAAKKEPEIGVKVVSVIIDNQPVKTKRPAAKIVKVTPDSPASRAGLKKGDVILRAHLTIVDSADQLAKLLDTYEPGDGVVLTTLQDNKKRKVLVRLSE